MNAMLDALRSRRERFINALERRIKVDVRYLLSGGFWLTMGQITSSASVFVLGLVFANFLPKETYGTYKYLLSLAGLLSIFTLPGMSTALTRAIARGFDDSLRIATSARIRWGLLGALLGLCAAAYYAFFGNSTLAGGVLIISLFLPFFDTFSAYSSYTQGKQDFRSYVLIGAVIQITSVAFMVAAILFTKNLFVILATYFASYTVLRFLAWNYVQRLYPPREGTDPELVSYGSHITLISVLSQIAGQADTLFTFHFLGPAAVAIYSIAIAAPDQVRNITGSIGDLLLPRLSQRSETESRASILRKSLLLLAVMVCIVAVYVVAAPFLYAIFFPKYHESIILTQLFALSMFNAFFWPFGIYLQAHGKVKEQYAIAIGTYSFQLISMVAGLIWFGLVGLIAARIATRYLGGFLQLIFYYFPLSKEQGTGA